MKTRIEEIKEEIEELECNINKFDGGASSLHYLRMLKIELHNLTLQLPKEVVKGVRKKGGLNKHENKLRYKKRGKSTKKRKWA